MSRKPVAAPSAPSPLSVSTPNHGNSAQALGGEPLLSAGNVVGQEDGSIALAIAASTDPQDRYIHTDEPLTLILRGVPEGASLSAGIRNADGSWTLTQGELNGLQFIPAPDTSGTFTLTVTAIAPKHGWKIPQSETSFTVQVDGVADTPELVVEGSAAGMEGGGVALTLDAGLTDGDGSETLAVVISGVPAGATLSAGVDNGDGTWTLTGADLAGLTLTPAAGFSGEITLGVTATATEGNGTTATATSSIGIHVEAVADVPRLEVPASLSGVEDSPIALSIEAALTDTDGSETLSVTLSGVPAGATLSAGVDNGDGTWSLTGAELAGLTLTPPRNYSGTILLGILAVATEANGAMASTQQNLLVSVAAVADAPALTLPAPLNAEAGEAVSVDMSAALADLDGSETLSVTIANLPEGSILSAGTNNGDGTWTLTGAELAGLTLTPSSTFTGTVALTVTALAVEANGSTATTTGTLEMTVGASCPSLIRGTANNDTLRGTDNHDCLYGLAGNDVIYGQIGDDILVGGLGNDYLSGDSGDDTFLILEGDGVDGINGGTGFDTVDATASSVFQFQTLSSVERILGNGATWIVTATTGENYLDFSTTQFSGIVGIRGQDGRDTITGTTGNDRIEGGSNIDWLHGGAGDDIIIGNAGPDRLWGNDGNDTFVVYDGDGFDLHYNGGNGYDVLDATATSNLQIYGYGNSSSHVEEIRGNGSTILSLNTSAGTVDLRTTLLVGISEIMGQNGMDTIYGSQANDIISGGRERDRLYGERGDDTFIVREGEGIDFFFSGGDGYDIIDATGSSSLMIETYEGTHTVEEIWGNGSTIISSDNSNNRMDFRTTKLVGIGEIRGLGSFDYIFGSAGDDVLNGGEGADYLWGGEGNDTFIIRDGEGPDNLISGGNGYDLIDATGTSNLQFQYGHSGTEGVEEIRGNGSTRISGTNYDNTLDFSNTLLVGTAEIDGMTGNDRITGTQGDDIIIGGGGNDTLIGGGGNDLFIVREGDGLDSIFEGGSGYDIIDATGTSNLHMVAHLNTYVVEEIRGNGATNIITNNLGNTLNFSNTLLVGIAEIKGMEGNDTITGSAQDNIINGGTGSDTLNGGGGNDTFRFETGCGADWLRDFSAGAGAGDVIDLSAHASNYNSLADVLGHTTQSYTDTVIDLGGGDTLTLGNVNMSTLNADDFNFG